MFYDFSYVSYLLGALTLLGLWLHGAGPSRTGRISQARRTTRTRSCDAFRAQVTSSRVALVRKSACTGHGAFGKSSI